MEIILVNGEIKWRWKISNMKFNYKSVQIESIWNMVNVEWFVFEILVGLWWVNCECVWNWVRWWNRFEFGFVSRMFELNCCRRRTKEKIRWAKYYIFTKIIRWMLVLRLSIWSFAIFASAHSVPIWIIIAVLLQNDNLW